MALPIRTTMTDLDKLCGYLVTKPTGATPAEAKAVLDSKVLDGRKISALKFWGLVEENGEKLRLTERGRQAVRDNGAGRSEVLRAIVRSVPAYAATVERAVHSESSTMTSYDVAALWHEHFNDQVSDSEKILNDQAVCFFQVAEGADLGKMVVGRKGQSTRFEFDGETARAFVEARAAPSEESPAEPTDDLDEGGEDVADHYPGSSPSALSTPDTGPSKGNKVFITHGKNTKILSSIKEIVAFGKFVPVVAMEHETAAKPVPEKVMDDMRDCQAAVIHVSSEGTLTDDDGNQVSRINENVLIEIGAAMALYRRNFVLLVEEGVRLPSNLQGLYECRYKGDELSGDATIKLLKAFNEFK